MLCKCGCGKIISDKKSHRFPYEMIKYLKGHNKGTLGRKYKMSDTTKQKISIAHKGKKMSAESRKKMSLFRRGKTPWNKGKKTGYAPWLGKKRPNLFTPEVKLKMSKSHLGRVVSLETRKKLSDLQKGEKGNNWKGGITPLRTQIWKSKEYQLWRNSVFERDNYTCIWCGQRGGKLQADHIKPFASYPELRFAIDNGRTLCLDCHKTTDTYLKGWLTK